MLFLVGAVVSSVVALLVLRRLTSGDRNNLGWMSQQWLTEHRSEHRR